MLCELAFEKEADDEAIFPYWKKKNKQTKIEKYLVIKFQH